VLRAVKTCLIHNTNELNLRGCTAVAALHQQREGVSEC
jgi:hypothetical protein